MGNDITKPRQARAACKETFTKGSAKRRLCLKNVTACSKANKADAGDDAAQDEYVACLNGVVTAAEKGAGLSRNNAPSRPVKKKKKPRRGADADRSRKRKGRSHRARQQKTPRASEGSFISRWTSGGLNVEEALLDIKESRHYARYSNRDDESLVCALEITPSRKLNVDWCAQYDQEKKELKAKTTSPAVLQYVKSFSIFFYGRYGDRLQSIFTKEEAELKEEGLMTPWALAKRYRVRGRCYGSGPFSGATLGNIQDWLDPKACPEAEVRFSVGGLSVTAGWTVGEKDSELAELVGIESDRKTPDIVLEGEMIPTITLVDVELELEGL